MDSYEILQKIAQVHQKTSLLSNQAEELSRSLKSNFKSVTDFKSAYEYMLRIQVETGGMRQEPDEEFVKENLKKALRHEYNAFFATADWLAISLRKEINETLVPFSAESIGKAIPDYYRVLRPRIVEISQEIADLRRFKDPQTFDETILDMEHYVDILQELVCIYSNITNSVSEILKFQEEQKKHSRMQWLRIVSGPVGVIIGYLLGKLF